MRPPIHPQPLHVLALALSAALIACSAPKPAVAPANVSHPILDTYALYDVATSRASLGRAFDFTAGTDTRCYVSESADTSESFEKVQVRWHRGATVGAGVTVVRLLGLSSAITTLDSAEIVFDSVRVRSLTSVYASGSCGAQARDGLPLRPVVLEEIGARKYSLKAYRRQRVEASADLQGRIQEASASLNGKVDVSSGSAFEVSFSSERWLGARLRGFERARLDTAWVENTPIGEWGALGTEPWRIRVRPQANGTLFSVECQNQAADVIEKHVDLSNSDAFSCGRQGVERGAFTGGKYYAAVLYIMPTAGEFQVRADIMTNRPIDFRSAESVRQWVQRRQ